VTEKETSVLFLLSSLDIGGSERKSVRIVNALCQRNHNIHLAWLNGPETLRQEVSREVPVYHLDRHGKFSWRALCRLKAYVRKKGIMRVVCVNLYPLIYAKALRLVMGSDAPSCVVTVNTTEFASRKHLQQMLLYAPLIRHADKIVFGSEYQLNLWMERYHLPRMKCCFIHNGVDGDYFSANAPGLLDIQHNIEFSVGAEDFTVGTVGNLRQEKRQVDLIEVVSRLRAQGLRIVALIVGGGSKEPYLRKQAAEYGVMDYIHFLGEMRDVRPALAVMNTFVLTSITETFSNAALEAMAMGKPMVLSDVGGAREMVWEGVNGYLYPATDVDRLAAILKDLADNPQMIRRMGEEARRIAVERFSFAHMVDEYEGLCRGE
jgi:glycosyltransferase involved in cell wall biosynthesis